MAAICNDWLEPLKPEFSKEYYKKLYYTIMDEYKKHLVFPPADDVFKMTKDMVGLENVE